MTWGSELADSLHGGPGGYSRNTFAALLAGQMYNCVAYPGIGNREIACRVKDASEQMTFTEIPHKVLVCWTWPGRDDSIDSDKEIIELQEFLEFFTIPYLFTCVDNCLITHNEKIKWKNWYLFPAGKEANETTTPRGFYQWAVENKYSIGIDGHPLEQAHRDAVTLIKEKFDELG